MSRSMTLVCIGIAAVCLAGCAAATNPLVGSWRLVSSDGATPESAGGGPAPVKVLDATHFAFGTMRPGDQVWAGGGRYEYAGGTYTEFVEYHSLPYLVGRRFTFECRLEGDLWYHTGGVDERGSSLNVNEVWRRVGSANALNEAERRRDTVRRR